MPSPFSKSDLLKILSVIATIPACFLLYFGIAALFLVSGPAAERIRYGVPATAASLGLLLLAAWFWSRAIDADSLWDSVGLIFLRAIGAIALAWVAVIVMVKLRGH
jgi:hypothetical protein